MRVRAKLIRLFFLVFLGPEFAFERCVFRHPQEDEKRNAAGVEIPVADVGVNEDDDSTE